MEKKKGLLIAAAVFAGVILLGTCITAIATMRNVKAIEATLENLSITWPAAQPANQVVYEDSGEEPSILTGSGASLEFAGEDTISLKSKTIACRAGVTPVEFKKGTKVKLKVKNTGKVYTLKQRENAFEGTIRLPLTEFADVEVILEDGEMVRSEDLEGKEAYINTDIAWGATGEQPRIQADSAIFKWDIDHRAPDGSTSADDFPEIQVIGLTGGKQVYRKTVQIEYFAEYEETRYPWEGRVPLKGSEKVELYATAPAKAGLTYRYKIGQVQKGMTDDFWADGDKVPLEILAPDGTVLSKIYHYEEEEEDEI